MTWKQERQLGLTKTERKYTGFLRITKIDPFPLFLIFISPFPKNEVCPHPGISITNPSSPSF